MGIYDFGMKSNNPTPSSFLQVASDPRTPEEQMNSAFALSDPDAPEILTARAEADAMININGADIRVYPRTDNADYDKVWDEDPDPTYLTHYNMKAFFKPQVLQHELKKWGFDTTSNTEVVFSHRQLYELLGARMLRPGDVLYLPYNAASINPVHYRITSAAPTGQYRYTWLYFTCNVGILKADTTIRPVDDMSPQQELEGGSAAFRESY